MRGGERAGTAEGVGAAPPAPRGRPPEMQDRLNSRIYHPLAARVAARLAPTPVTPNMVSIAGGLCIIIAALLYTRLPWPWSAALGFLFHASWHVLDGADGDLARMTGRSSPYGELVDGMCDYFGHAFLYLALGAFAAAGQLGGWAWALAWGAGLSHIAQANHGESGRRTYLHRVHGVPWLRESSAGGEVARGRGPLAAFLNFFARLYLRIAGAVSPSSPAVEGLLARPATPAGRARAAALAREAGATGLRVHTLLGANWRTVLLGASMALGSPLPFFVLTIIGGNALLLWSLRHNRRADARLAVALDRELAAGTIR